jgi:hypothetical protein
MVAVRPGRAPMQIPATTPTSMYRKTMGVREVVKISTSISIIL